MAAITISAAGGDWNNTATWVGGVIPTTSDHVVGDATSGQLTVNVSASVQYVDFTSYTQILTINSGILLQLTLAGSTNTFGSGMDFAGTGTIQFNSVASTIVQNTTNRIPNVRFTGSVTRTLSTNVYVSNLIYVNDPTFNGNTMYVGGDFYTTNTMTAAQNEFGGTTNFELDGTGIIHGEFKSTVTITGDYNTFGFGVFLFDGSTLNYTSGAAPTLFNVTLNKRINTAASVTLNVSQLVNLFYVSTTSGINTLLTVNLSAPLTADLIAPIPVSRDNTSPDITPTELLITGDDVTANTLSVGPIFRATSATTNPPAAGSLTWQANDIILDPTYNYTFGTLQLMGGTTANSLIRSNNAGVPVSIFLGSKITSQICNYDFTDVDASGGDQIVAINGTLSNTTNITNVYPTGGGGETTHISVS